MTSFVPRSAEGWRDPFSMYADLRDTDPAHHVVDGNYWVLSRHADVIEAARDTETFSSAQGLTFTYDDLASVGLDEIAPMVFLDPPDHTEFRRLVARGFTPRQVTSIEPEVREFVISRIQALCASSGGGANGGGNGGGNRDIVAELLKPLPTMVVGHYLGVPVEDRSSFDGWVEQIVGASATGNIFDAMETVAQVIEYFTALVETRRVSPGEDVISELVQAGDGAAVDPMRILGFAFTMMTGGNDTSTGMLSVGLELLSQQRDQWRLLVDQPDLIPNAVTELLRLSSPVQGLARTTTRDVELHEKVIPAQTKVLLLYASANRDPRQFGPTAADLDVTRPAGPILTFGHGAHYCLGAAAARLMGRVVLEELTARCPDFTVDGNNGRFSAGHFVRWYESLPFDPHGYNLDSH
ncbi:cytochrome P450 [Actinobacteria bacterium IMCC26207]|nr:cytochrome P450 [Actinobacteria bacterium IMCC26207]